MPTAIPGEQQAADEGADGIDTLERDSQCTGNVRTVTAAGGVTEEVERTHRSHAGTRYGIERYCSVNRRAISEPPTRRIQRARIKRADGGSARTCVARVERGTICNTAVSMLILRSVCH